VKSLPSTSCSNGHDRASLEAKPLASKYDAEGVLLLSSVIVPQSTQDCNSISGEDLAVRTHGIRRSQRVLEQHCLCAIVDRSQ
jgi:hypothetical protein